jgi:sulfonate transport system ATP-binding protein
VDEAIALGDRILVMRDGRIASEHPVDLDVERRARGAGRDRLRAELLTELGLPAVAA